MSDGRPEQSGREPEGRDDVERYGLAAALAIVGLGLVLRLQGLSEYWLNPDEGIYYSALTMSSFSDFWDEVTLNAHPPAFYLLLRAVGSVTWDFVWLRGVSLVAGTAAIWLVWLVGREVGGKGRAGVVTGLVAAGLLAVSPDSIVLSQVLRPYTLLLALVSAALLYLLRYRSEPTNRTLALYAVFVSAAMLTHYSAALAYAAFVAIVGYYFVADTLDRKAWERLAVAQAVPAVVLAGLYLQHLGTALESDLVGEALDPGGWLSDWLIESPSDAWLSFVAFNKLLVPSQLQGRAALLLLVAVGASAVSRDRWAAVVGGSAVAVAVAASALGLYPLGPSRHNAWLVVFVLPVVGWLVAWIVERGRLPAMGAGGLLLLALAFGAPLESALGAYTERSNATEEQLMRRRDLAPLVVDKLDPEGQPRLILMTFQTYNLLMPLYAPDRERLTSSSTPVLFSFPYGSRDVVVSSKWDWAGVEDVRTLVGSLPETLPEVAPGPPEQVLVLAGGWGSSIFPEAVELERRAALLDAAWTLGPVPGGEPVIRLMALSLERAALEVEP